MSVISERAARLRPLRAARRLRISLEMLATVAAVATSAVAAWNFVVAPLAGSFSGAFEDFSGYAQAAQAVAAGVSPYAHFSSSTIVMSGFDYPPLVAMLLRPFDLLTAHWQQVVWLWLSLASLVAGSVITARTLLPADWPRARLGVAVGLSFPPATYNLWHGQMNLVIFLLLAVALSDYVAGRRTRCAVILGIAASIKLAPLLLLVVLARRGWWRAVAAGLGTVAAGVALGLVTLGWSVTRQYALDIVPVLSRDNGWFYNQSWNGLVSRLAQHSVLAPSAPSAAVHTLVLVLSVVTVAVLFWVVSRRPRTRTQRATEFACGIVAMLLVGSVAWYPVYAELLIPLAAAVALACEQRINRAALLGWATASTAAAVAGAAVIAGLSMASVLNISRGPLWWLFLQAWSLPVVAAAGLLGAFVVGLRAPLSRAGAPAR